MTKKKKPGLSKRRPPNEARPLGTPRAAKKAKPEKEAQKDVDAPRAPVVDSSHPVEAHPAPDDAAQKQQENVMTLTLKGLVNKGRTAVYRGAAASIHIRLGAFPSRQAPTTIDVADGVFAERKAPKVKMTADERKAYRLAHPKPALTLAEKVARAEQRAAALKAKLDAATQPAL